MFYGLAEMEEEYFADRIHKFIALAPCIYYQPKYVNFDTMLAEWRWLEDLQ